MGQVERDAGAFLAQVEHGQALQEELAEDDPFVKAVEPAAADAPGQRLQSRADLLPVARIERAQPVAQHDPFDRPTAVHGALLPSFPDGLAVDARPQNARRRAAEPGQQVEIDETVVDRRDQNIGPRDRMAGQRIIGARTVQNDVIVAGRQPVDQGIGAVAPGRTFGDAAMLRELQVQAFGVGEAAAVLDIAAQRALMSVEIDACHRLAGPQQGDDEMHRGGRFAGSALLVAEHDHRTRFPAAGRRVRRHVCRPVAHSALSLFSGPAGRRRTIALRRLCPRPRGRSR